MPEIISCPACQRRLQVPEEYFGQTVQCPECKHTFAAVPAGTALPTTTPPAATPAPQPKPEREPEQPASRRPRRYYDDLDDDDEPPRRRRRYAPEEDDYDDQPRRRYVAPHRGALVLTFGLISLCLCVAPIFGPLAWIMGTADLAQIRAGTMDRDGQSLTQAGRILGIITTCFVLCFIALLCLVTFLKQTGVGHF
jgi:hypothetical protein